jgi:hypothetical protein
MNVENPPRKLLHEPGREQPHVSSEAHQIYLVLLQRGNYFAVMFFPWLTLRRNHHDIESTLPCRSDAGRVRSIGDHNRDARRRNASPVNAIRDGHKV